MSRGIRSAFPLILLCTILAACGHFGSSVAARSQKLPAIALSVPRDNIYLVDPVTRQHRTVASRLSDFQNKFAS